MADFAEIDKQSEDNEARARRYAEENSGTPAGCIAYWLMRIHGMLDLISDDINEINLSIDSIDHSTRKD